MCVCTVYALDEGKGVKWSLHQTTTENRMDKTSNGWWFCHSLFSPHSKENRDDLMRFILLCAFSFCVCRCAFDSMMRWSLDHFHHSYPLGTHIGHAISTYLRCAFEMKEFYLNLTNKREDTPTNVICKREAWAVTMPHRRERERENRLRITNCQW